jgi:nicotinamidase-related amidase
VYGAALQSQSKTAKNRARSVFKLAKRSTRMRDVVTLDAGQSQLVVVDVQARLAAAMPAERRARALDALRLLGTAARLLGVPVTVTEHVPSRIGGTDPEALACLDAPTVLQKVHFGAANEPHIVARLESLERPRLLVLGMEAHVCVLQTALGLKARGHDVGFVVDASCSRCVLDEELALARASRHGIEPLSAEMVAFEWLHRADHPARAALIRAIKARSVRGRGGRGQAAGA